jgi:hypothetical protein
VSLGETIGVGLRRATRWRLLVLCAALTAIPAALATFPIWALLSTMLAHAPRAELLAHGLEGSWLPDLLRAVADSRQGHAIPGGILGGIVVALLLAPALAGAILAEAGSDHPLRFRPLLTGAGRFYGRMLRTTLVAAIPLGLAGAAANAISRGAGRAMQASLTESAAAARWRWALLAGGAILVAAHLTVDAARARIADRPDRRSALAAWLSGTWLVLRHPLQSGAIALAGLAAGPLLGLAVMALRERLPPGPGWSIAAGVVLAQLAAMAVGWGRAIRVIALTRLSRDDRRAGEERRLRAFGRAAPPPPEAAGTPPDAPPTPAT